ncbi:COG3014 family protein [Thaumasiovibrio subtropicus]|uniref:COG3014 family protein n=1 Tax=Thaumasiovibrio subtropicus TaxID=1891207 RepID=UPI00131C1B54|nr:hypothetical protein [Thaumasiovibrio subtropicus]
MKKVVLGIFTVLLSGCAGLSVQNMFGHYSESNAAAYHYVKSGDYSQAQAALSDAGGAFLYGAESGRVAFLQQDYAASMAALKAADAYWTEEQRQAQIRISEGIEQATSLFLNDNVISYEPSPYEVGFLHLYLGLNYLQAKDLDGALVEMRRANRVQESVIDFRKQQAEIAQREAKQQQMSDNVSEVLKRYPDKSNALGARQNAYLFFLSALLYEADGDLNSAFVDIQRALNVVPDNKAVVDTAMRIAKRAGRRTELKALQRQYGQYKVPSRDTGTLIIIDEQQVVSAKQMWRLPLVLWDNNYQQAIYNLSLPYYSKQRFTPYRPIKVDNSDLDADLVTDTNLMASQALSDDMFAIVTRQALRIVAKDQLRQSAVNSSEDEYKELSNAVFNIFNMLTDQADTRSWQTLPASVYLSTAQYELNEVTLSSRGNQWTVPIQPGRITLFWVSRQGNQATGWHVLLGANR